MSAVACCSGRCAVTSIPLWLHQHISTSPSPSTPQSGLYILFAMHVFLPNPPPPRPTFLTHPSPLSPCMCSFPPPPYPSLASFQCWRCLLFVGSGYPGGGRNRDHQKLAHEGGYTINSHSLTLYTTVHYCTLLYMNTNEQQAVPVASPKY